MRTSSRIRRGLVYAFGFVLLAVAPVVALNSLANADPGAAGYEYGRADGRPPEITDAQRQCLTDHGVTLPKRGADGSRPELTAQQRDTLRKAAAACSITWRHGMHSTATRGMV